MLPHPTTSTIARRTRALLVVVVMLVFAPGMPPEAQASEPSANEYQTAVGLYKQQKWKQATALLRKMLPKLKTLQQKQSKGSKPYHLLSLGQADLYFYLAQIATRRGQPQQACHHYDALVRRLKSLPQAWSTWAVQPHLPAQMKQAQQTHAKQCSSLPSRLTFQVKPTSATLSYRHKQGPWKKITGQQLNAPPGPLQLKAAAPGYEPLQSTLQIKRWEVRTISLSLKKKPPPRRRKVVIARRLPPPKAPPKSVFQTWWFWTITGTVVVGATVGVVLYVTLPRDIQLGPDDNGTRLW